MSRLAELLEGIAARVENLRALDPPADAVQKVTGALPAGRVKDLLSGTDLGHPLHPLLVTVPIGAFGSALALDLTGDAEGARRLIGLGILASLPTAASGASDWSDTMGAERRVGLLHAALNTVALGAFATSWVLRRSPGRGRLTTLVGLGFIGASGWLGGHLSYAMGVGVDTTAFSSPPSDWTDVGAEDELTDGEPHAFTAGELSILVVRRDGALSAIGNRCTHRGAPLDEGPVVGDCIECPWHGSRFRLADGQIERGPASRPQPVFEARVVAGRVQVRKAEERALRTNPV
jgi:nitrite reductase/ring-hydroxylating ferredoxin subunit/uncharacterized membrane protein